MNVTKLKAWLMQQPRPAFVRVTSMDGQVNEVSCTTSTWPKTSETIAALQPELLQAFNVEKQMLRAVRPNDDASDDWQEDDSDPEGPRVPPLRDVPITASDPETQRFALVAQLIAQAYQHSNSVAFDRLAQIAEGLMARSEAVERMRDQVYRTHIKQLEEQIKALGQEPEQDAMGQMLGNFLGGMGLGNQASAPAPAAPTPNGSTNGKGTHHA
jgi:hypothetical protein